MPRPEKSEGDFNLVRHIFHGRDFVQVDTGTAVALDTVLHGFCLAFPDIGNRFITLILIIFYKMANLIVLAGFSNSGKSTSLKYLDSSETFIVSCTNKQLQIPGFRKKYKKVAIEDKKLVGNWLVSNSYEKIHKILDIVDRTRSDIKIVVIDDINYCLSGEIMDNALVKGYEKFTMQAKNYYDLITKAGELRDDLTVVFISHIINDGTDIDPQYKMYSSGKMLDKTVNIDGLFSYIIYSERYIDEATGDVGYRFKTRTDGNDTCRSVAGCFNEKYIEPNMKLIIDTINKFEEGEE